MKNYSIASLLLAFFLLSGRNTGYAIQEDTTELALSKYPIAVLVKLKTQQRMVAALIKDKRYKQLEEVKKDIAGEQAATIHDFSDNFNYCPVYYYIDTNENLIMKKQFAGVLLNADGSIATNPVITPADTDYAIVYFGYPTEQPNFQSKVTDTGKYINNSGEPMGRGLIINNDKMEQINYLYELGYDNLFRSKSESKYSYVSKHFNIEYAPSAKDFNNKLGKRVISRRLGRHIYKKKAKNKS